MFEQLFLIYVFTRILNNLRDLVEKWIAINHCCRYQNFQWINCHPTNVFHAFFKESFTFFKDIVSVVDKFDDLLKFVINTKVFQPDIFASLVIINNTKFSKICNN